MADATTAEITIGEHNYKVMDYQEYKRVIYDPGVVTRIIINRPRYRNALSHPTLAEIEHAFGRAAANSECRVIVLSGAGSCFSGGDDALGLTPESAPVMASGEKAPADSMQEYGSEGEVWRHYQDEHFHLLHGMHGRLRNVMKPTIAMVHGWCIFNAFSMASTMDLVFASEDALFVPAGGDAAFWAFGPRKAMEILYEHRFLTARECHELGLVNRVYPDFATLEKETLGFAYRVADNPVHLHRRTKETIHHLMDLQGFATAYHGELLSGLAYGGGPAVPIRDVASEDRHRERYEGRGMARTPKALANLRAKLESERAEVPQNVLGALARAGERDDRAAWERATRQEWREKGHLDRADRDSSAYDAGIEAFRTKIAEEKARRGL